MTFDPGELRKLAEDYAAAWTSGSARDIASFYAQDGGIVINRGGAHQGRDAVAKMAEGFHSEFPDLVVRCDLVRSAGSHVIFVWTLEGHHADTGNRVVIGGWEEWELDADMKVKSSLGWFDETDYNRQVAGESRDRS